MYLGFVIRPPAGPAQGGRVEVGQNHAGSVLPTGTVPTALTTTVPQNASMYRRTPKPAA
jgi:hypothetical protein